MRIINILTKFFFIVLVSYGSCPLMGQPSKRQLTESDYGLWGRVIPGTISRDGKWVSWSVHYDQGQDTLFVASANGKKQFCYPGVRKGFFCGKEGFFCQQDINSGEITRLSSGVRKRIEGEKAAPWGEGIITSDKQSGQLLLWDVKGNNYDTIADATQYFISPSGNTMLYTQEMEGSKNLILYQWDSNKNLKSSLAVGTMEKSVLKNITWAEDEKTLALLAVSDSSTTAVHIDLQAGNINRLGKAGLGNTFRFDWSNPALTSNGEVLLYVVRENIPETFIPLAEVWNTRDRLIYPVRTENREWEFTPKLVLWHPVRGTVHSLSDTAFPKATVTSDGRFALLWDPLGHEPQYQWMPNIDLYATDLKTDKTKRILSDLGTYAGAWQVSPNGRYITYFRKGNWYNYDIASDREILLSGKVRDSLSEDSAIGKPIWAKDGKALLLYDTYDIWQLTADGSKSKRLTRGKENGIMYRIPPQEALVSQKAFGDAYTCQSIDLENEIILEKTAADHSKSGYSLLQSNGLVKELFYESSRNYSPFYTKGTLLWLSERFDFPTQVACTMLTGKPVIVSKTASLKDFYWGKVQRVTYTKGNDTLSGLLYYPAGFEKGKKYPMIVSIYEKQSQRIHHFFRPSLYDGDGFNVTNYTAKGYFVLLPDITYTIGKPGESSLLCTEAAVTAAMDYESSIDSRNIGLIGYSFGGYEASYIATASKMFKAIAAGAAITDLASDYLSQAGHYNIAQYYRYETFQMRMGSPLHENIRGYIDNSPVYRAAGIAAPILIYTGGSDVHIRHWHSKEFYFALRRLGKEGFMIVYPQEEHAFMDREAMADLSSKVTAFFGHYLKGESPAPWMHPK